MKTYVVISKMLLIMAILFSAILLAGFSDFFDSLSLIFVVSMTFFLTIAGFSPKQIKNSIIAVFSIESKHSILIEAKEYWLSLIRNLIVSGVFGTLIGFILILGRLDDPSKVDPMMSIAYLTFFYAVLFTLILPIPAYFIITERLQSVSKNDEIKRHYKTKSGLISSIIGIIGIITVFLISIGFPKPEISVFFSRASIQFALGGGVAFTTFSLLKKEKLGGYLTLGMALSSMIGLIGGLIQMFRYSNNLSKIGPAAALSMLSLFIALFAMILVSFPISDKYQYKGDNTNSIFRLTEFVFPLLVLIFSSIIMFMIFAKI